ncbi:hypothetical protein [Dactylosporangium sp. NPDC005555]|uniref:effector-associated constant component EACC1 n=1 Tax=Dactylosporangium sp. NPDC005555 TaxID=3154889 RepID=UPI0033AB0C29
MSRIDGSGVVTDPDFPFGWFVGASKCIRYGAHRTSSAIRHRPGAAVEVQINVDAGDDEEALVSFYRWLLEDPEVSRLADVSMAMRTPSPEMMGGVEVISVVASNAIALGSLVVAFLSWRDSRPRRSVPIARLERGDVTVTIEGGSADEIRAIIAAVGGQEQS